MTDLEIKSGIRIGSLNKTFNNSKLALKFEPRNT